MPSFFPALFECGRHSLNKKKLLEERDVKVKGRFSRVLNALEAALCVQLKAGILNGILN